MVSMQLGWMAGRVELEGNRQAMWRTDARRNGVGGVINDASCNCQFVIEFITGYRITDVCASARPCVAGRLIPDDATVLVRTDQGIDGVFLLSQIAAGHREGLVFEITGDTGSMRWCESNPGTLVLVANDATKKVLTDKTAPGAIGGVDTPFVAGDAYVEVPLRRGQPHSRHDDRRGRALRCGERGHNQERNARAGGPTARAQVGACGRGLTLRAMEVGWKKSQTRVMDEPTSYRA